MIIQRHFSSLLLIALLAVSCSTFQKHKHQNMQGLYWNPKGLVHDLEGHTESKLRQERIIEVFRQNLNFNEVSTECKRLASDDELKLAHDLSYIKEIKTWNGKEKYFRKDRWSPYWSKEAFEAAASAAACAIDLSEDIFQGKIQNGMAVIRPPGHHAVRNWPIGYSLFNNIGIAVKSLQKKHPGIRIAIVDIDAHHGNGLQDLFYEDANVLYISSHQDSWPFTGKLELTGKGSAVGNTINVPLPPDTADNGYRKIFDEIISPSVRRFRPEMLIVANGYDAHWRDPNSFLGLSLKGHADLSSSLKKLSEDTSSGKIVFILEGGYDLDVLSNGSLNTYRILTGKSDLIDPFGPSPRKEPEIQSVLEKVKKLHRL